MSPSLKKMTKIIGLNLRVSNGFDLIKLRISLKNLSLKYSKQLDFEVELLDQGSGRKPSIHNLYKTDPFSTFSALPFDNVL